MKDWTDHAFSLAIAFATAALLFVAFCAATAGCVTRTTVCVETAHGVGPADGVYRRDSVGASVCADVERP